MIYQELSPIKELSIAENVFVGRYPKTRAGAIDWKTMYDSCQKIFDRWGLNYNPRTKIKMLKTADIQMIEIIKAISFNAQLVIMDELDFLHLSERDRDAVRLHPCSQA